MTNENPTKDLSKFGYRELELAAKLLTALTTGGQWPDELGDGVTIELNTSSGNVFLTDEDYNVAMMNGDKLETFFSCWECGEEGFKEDLDWNEDHNCCNGCVKE